MVGNYGGFRAKHLKSRGFRETRIAGLRFEESSATGSCHDWIFVKPEPNRPQMRLFLKARGFETE
jgi:hypothetical protein